MAPPNSKKKKKVSTHIPDDLAVSILSKLPLKSLKRFTCARKSWTLFLENPRFIKMFCKSFISAHCSLYDDTFVLLKQTVPTPWYYGLHCLLYLLDGEKFDNKVKLEFPRRFQEEDTHEWPLDISGCVNGIICLFDVQNENGIFWNPATKECIHIPPSPSQFLASNSTIFTVHGFGYEHVRDDYKVIRCVMFQQYNPRVEFEARLAYVPAGPGALWEIYSLRSDSWRKLDVNVPHKLGCSEVYLNGACHWLGGTWLGETFDELPVINCVVSFNLNSEVFVTTPLLFDMHDGDDSELPKRPKRELVVLNGSIAMISKYSTTASFHISILGEPGFEGSWVKLFIVGPLPFIRGRPIGAGKNSEIFFRTKYDDLVCFDLNTQKFEEVGLKGVVSCQTLIYKRNLFPIIRV